MGINAIRVWGGGFPEKSWLYDLCDEMGILIWQDFPLSSSGMDNSPTDPEVINVMVKIVNSYLNRLQHHVSVLLWCGGNELYEMGDGTSVNDKHPMIHAMKERVNLIDPNRRFNNGSPSGPNPWGSRDNFG